MWNLRNKKNKRIKNRLTNVEDDLEKARGEGFGGPGVWDKGLKKNKLVVDKWS